MNKRSTLILILTLALLISYSTRSSAQWWTSCPQPPAPTAADVNIAPCAGAAGLTLNVSQTPCCNYLDFPQANQNVTVTTTGGDCSGDVPCGPAGSNEEQTVEGHQFQDWNCVVAVNDREFWSITPPPTKGCHCKRTACTWQTYTGVCNTNGAPNFQVTYQSPCGDLLS